MKNVFVKICCFVAVCAAIAQYGAMEEYSENLKKALAVLHEQHEAQVKELTDEVLSLSVRVDGFKNRADFEHKLRVFNRDYSEETRYLVRRFTKLDDTQEAEALQEYYAEKAQAAEAEDFKGNGIWQPDKVNPEIHAAVRTFASELADVARGLILLQLSMAHQLNCNK